MAEKKTTSKKKAAKAAKAGNAAKAAKRPKAAKKQATAALGARKKAAPAKAARKKKKAVHPAAGSQLTPEQRFVETQQRAYLLAERDGFARNPTHYWLDAEAELDNERTR